MEKKFNKTAVKSVLDLLRNELKDCRDDVRSTYIKDIEEKIKKAKERITRIGLAYSATAGNGDDALFLEEEREKAEKDLENWRDQFKVQSKATHDSKEMIRHLEHAISTLKKEFAQ